MHRRISVYPVKKAQQNKQNPKIVAAFQSSNWCYTERMLHSMEYTRLQFSLWAKNTPTAVAAFQSSNWCYTERMFHKMEHKKAGFQSGSLSSLHGIVGNSQNVWSKYFRPEKKATLVRVFYAYFDIFHLLDARWFKKAIT